MIITKKLIKRLQKDYYFRGHSAQDLATRWNLKKATVNYHLGKIQMTQTDFLDKYYSKKELLELVSVNSYKESALILKIPMARFEVLLHRKGIKRTREDLLVNTIDRSFYIEKPLSFYYYLGLIATDGYIRNNSVRIVIKNAGAKALFNRIKELTNFQGKIVITCNDFYEMTFTDKDLVKTLNEFGVPSTRKTYELDFPQSPLTKEQTLCYLLGVLDGDGCIYTNSMGFTFCSASKKFVKGICTHLIQMFGVNPIVYNKPTVQEVRFSSQDSKFLLSNMYNTCPLFLECKFQKFINVRKFSRK